MKPILTFFTALLIVNAQAQEITIETPSVRGFSGVNSMNGEVVYTSWFGEKTDAKGMANFILKLYDKDLKEIKSVTLELTKYSELASSAFTGKNFLFIFVDAMKKNRTMVTLDAAGNVIQRKSEEDVRRALLIPENFPVIHVLNDDEFFLLRPMKEKKFGFDMERIDKNLTSKWVKSHIPEEGILKAVDSKIQNGKLFLLREKNPSRSSDNFVYSVQSFNLNTGEQVYSVDLLNQDDGGAPSFIRVTADGGVATGGMYFKGAKYDDKNSDGLFFALISPAGAITQYSKNSWSSLKDQISGEFSSALIGGKTKIMVEDVITKNDGSYMVIAEQFKKANNASMTGLGAAAGMGGVSVSSGSSEVGFTVLDFVFFNFDNAGKLTGIDVVSKESKEARVSGKIAQEKGLAIAQYMKEKGFFSYKGVIENNGQQVILYRNDEGFKSKAYFLPVDAKSTSGIPSIDMDKWISDKANKVGILTKAATGNQYTFNSDSITADDYERYKNISYFGNDKMLLYDFNLKGLKIWLQPIPVQ